MTGRGDGRYRRRVTPLDQQARIARARREIVEVCRALHARGLIAAQDGNVSVRVGEDRLLMTPAGARKGHLDEASLVLTDLEGRPVEGAPGSPSSERGLHTEVYARRPDVGAVVHAHPPCAVAHTIAGVPLEPLMPEVAVELGDIVTLPYTSPGTSAVAETLARHLEDRVALVMSRHGSITLGPTLAKAYDRLEILEHTARISLMARVLAPGRVEPLPASELARLLSAH